MYLALPLPNNIKLKFDNILKLVVLSTQFSLKIQCLVSVVPLAMVALWRKLKKNRFHYGIKSNLKLPLPDCADNQITLKKADQNRSHLKQSNRFQIFCFAH